MRLVCYHLFHWSCLDAYCRSLPPDTAPAGYLCPVAGCNCQIFPPDNLVSPVADKLRSVLQVTTLDPFVNCWTSQMFEQLNTACSRLRW